jgi:threonyl-tRNA synthetase
MLKVLLRVLLTARSCFAYKIAESISPQLAQDVLAAEINGIVRDLNIPVNNNAVIKFLKFEDEGGKEVYWHSTSHLMAHAVQEIYPEAKFGVGPAIDSGFYYDIDINTQLKDEDLRKIEQRMEEISKKNNPFTREEISKEDAVKFFVDKGDPYKLEILSEIDENSKVISLYKEGSFTDLCTGPHLPSTGKIKYVKLLNISGSYWRGDEHNKQLQRIYGISFPKKKMLDDYLAFLEEAKKRDHRKLGKQLDLYSTHRKPGRRLDLLASKRFAYTSRDEDFWRKLTENGYEILFTPHMGKGGLGNQRASRFL